MKTAEPLRNKKDVDKLKKYFYERGEYRNYLLITIGLNTALRISDILNLKWKDIYDFNRRRIKKHIEVVEKKTGKQQRIYVNKNVKEAIKLFISKNGIKGDFIFTGKNKDTPLDRTYIHKLLKKVCLETGIPNISCHSLRKTFGYQAWKKGVPPAVLMSIYNHSSYAVTKRYLCINQDDKDDVYKNVVL